MNPNPYGLVDWSREDLVATLPAQHECHLWLFHRTASAPSWRTLVSVLDEGERDTVRSLQTQSSRDLFVASRGLQRLLLGWYLEADPRLLRTSRICSLCGANHGAPRVVGNDDIRYSVSHSGPWIGLAFVAGGAVGFDVEAVQTKNNDSMASRILSPRERVLYAQDPTEFYRFWARKEATVKLTGHGVTTPLDKIDVVSDVVLVAIEDRPASWPIERIGVQDIVVDAEHVASVAWTGIDKSVSARSLEDLRPVLGAVREFNSATRGLVDQDAY